jgi:MFS family permease
MSSFGIFWIAQSISRFGDPITLIALATITYRATHSALYTSLAVVMATVPTAAFGFIGGVLADRIGPRTAMIASDGVRAVLIGAVPVALSAGLPLATAYLCVFGAAVCAAIFNPARIAIVPRLVSPERLTEANSKLGSTDRVVEILGAAAAGFLVASVGADAFYFDALTFGLSALVLTRVRSDTLSRRFPWSPGSDATSGVRILLGSAVLRANTLFSLVAQLALPVVNGLTPVLMIRRFAAGNVDLGAQLFGMAEAALASGAAAAGFLLPEYIGGKPKGQILVSGFTLYGLLLIALAATSNFLVALVIFFAMGVANILFLVPNVTITQEFSPPEFRARVAGARLALLNLSWLPIFALSGYLADRVDAGALIAIGGLITFGTAVGGWLWPTVRDVS